jgi:F0F1-type ATP synthase assembly protein I
MMSTPTPSAKNETQSVLMSLKLVFELGYIIAIPIVLFGFGGAYADKAWGTSPWLLLFGMLTAATLSAIGILRKIKAIHRTEFGGKSAP